MAHSSSDHHHHHHHHHHHRHLDDEPHHHHNHHHDDDHDCNGHHQHDGHHHHHHHEQQQQYDGQNHHHRHDQSAVKKSHSNHHHHHHDNDGYHHHNDDDGSHHHHHHHHQPQEQQLPDEHHHRHHHHYHRHNHPNEEVKLAILRRRLQEEKETETKLEVGLGGAGGVPATTDTIPATTANTQDSSTENTSGTESTTSSSTGGGTESTTTGEVTTTTSDVGGHRCGTASPPDEVKDSVESAFREWARKNDGEDGRSSDDDDVIEIPVFWHSILTASGTQNITDHQIVSSLQVLNDAFDFKSTIFVFQLQAVTKTKSDLYWSAEPFSQGSLAMKAQLREGACNTLNIYSTGQRANLGWSSFPWECNGADYTVDGVVINYQTVPGGSLVPFNKGDTLVHSVGHWLGLYHTFEGLSCDGPGDYVSDTAQERRPALGCPKYKDDCPDFLEDDITNYMNFADDYCMDHFTDGQIDRMKAQWDRYRKPPPIFPTKAPTAAPESFFSSCFSHVGTVIVQGKGPTKMANLQLYDRVMTATGRYQPVYAFAHQNSNNSNKQQQSRDFLRIHTKQNSKRSSPLEITGDHLIFVVNKADPVRADSIRVGHKLKMATTATAAALSDDTQQEEEEGALVTKIDIVQRADLYAPLTLDGTIVVDGIVSSCYVALQQNNNNNKNEEDGCLIQQQEEANISMTGLSQQTLAHMLLAPIRMACIGISANKICTTFNDDGLAFFVAVGLTLANLGNGQNVLIQVGLAMLFWVVFGPLFVLEQLLGPTLSAWTLLVALLSISARVLGNRRRHHGVLRSSPQKSKQF